MLSNILIALVGLAVGVLVNRAADNLPPPERRSILQAPRCPYCGVPRKGLEHVAILGFVLGRGRCPNCRSPLSLRGPIVELGSALMFVFLLDRYGASLSAVGFCLATAGLLLITVIDLEHRLILNVIVLPFTFIALLLSPLLVRSSSPKTALLFALVGAAVGYVLVYVIYLFGILFVRLAERARGRRVREVAFGLGDVKLAGCVGALVGFPAVLYALVYAILLGGLAAFLVLLFQAIVRRRYAAFMGIPYGPFIALAAWAVMIGVVVPPI